jgi:toxin ParE1/3/4
MKVVWSPLAIDCVSDVAEFIAKDKPKAAEKWVDAVFDKVKNRKIANR